MSNNIQTSFSIKDLENLSGIKAHTIRIWEKRHNLLAPNRSDTNIRTYDIKNLKRLLNIQSNTTVNPKILLLILSFDFKPKISEIKQRTFNKHKLYCMFAFQ